MGIKFPHNHNLHKKHQNFPRTNMFWLKSSFQNNYTTKSSKIGRRLNHSWIRISTGLVCYFCLTLWFLFELNMKRVLCFVVFDHVWNICHCEWKNTKKVREREQWGKFRSVSIFFCLGLICFKVLFILFF